jgi:hypothetical protein
MTSQPTIQAVVVNHNTSAFAELMLRSLFATHPALPNLSLRVYDNASTDDSHGLRAYAARMNVPVLPSGFPIHTQNNSHGEVLLSFVLENSACDYYLFRFHQRCLWMTACLGAPSWPMVLAIPASA